MDFISPNVSALSPSLTLAVTNRAKEMKANGEQVFGLAGGEPDKDTPENIKQAAIKALENGATKYTPSVGLPQLRQAIADKLKRDNNLEYSIDQICVASGAKAAVFNALRATIGAGDEVIIPSPYWVSYPSMVEICGGTPVFVETTAETGWKITAEQFADAMTPRTKMILLTTPHNPTGAVYTEEELRAIGEVAVEEDILILADEIYEHLIYDGLKHVSIASLSPELYNLTITVNGFSKGYAMTGWRLGYTAAPVEIAKYIRLIQDLMTLFDFKYKIEISTRPEDSIGTDEAWELATNALIEAVRKEGLPYSINEGDGAFYGPKIDVKLLDCIGREWQCSTIQVDFTLPERFNLTYVGQDGERHRPVMVHRAIMGSVERFIGVLIEQYAGALPVWLAPEQARLLTVTDAAIDAARDMEKTFAANGIRVSLDDRNEKLGFKVREAQVNKIPYMLVVGEKEAQSGTVSVRLRTGENLGMKTVEETIELIRAAAAEPFTKGGMSYSFA